MAKVGLKFYQILNKSPKSAKDFKKVAQFGQIWLHCVLIDTTTQIRNTQMVFRNNTIKMHVGCMQAYVCGQGIF